MKESIKQCPHCGGNADLYSRKTYKGGYYIFVQCEICGATGKSVYSSTAPEADNWESNACNVAVNAWNMRTPGM